MLSSLWGTLVRGSLPPLLSTLIPVEKPENQLTSTICSTKTKWPKDLYTFSIIGTGTWYHGTERIIRIVSRKILSFDFIFLSFNFCWFFTTRFIRAVMSQFTHNTHTVCLFFNYAFKKKSLSVGKVEMWKVESHISERMFIRHWNYTKLPRYFACTQFPYLGW